MLVSKWVDYEWWVEKEHANCQDLLPPSTNLLLLRKQEFYPMAIGIIGIGGDRLTWKKFQVVLLRSR